MSWEDATKKIARLLKDGRNRNFIAHNDKGQLGNRWPNSGMLASSAALNETGVFDLNLARGPDCQARLCHTPAVVALDVIKVAMRPGSGEADGPSSHRSAR